MSSPRSTEVAAAAREVLESSNLDEINERKLRQIVQERTGADTSLPDLKALIHSVVEEFLGEQDKEEVETSKASKGSKLKKRKTEDSGEDEDADEEEDLEEGHRQARKVPKQQPAKKFQVGENGELLVCKLSNKRRVSVGEYRGTLFVSIREFYEKNGQELPGKGISLPVEQWETLSQHINDVNAAIKQAQR